VIFLAATHLSFYRWGYRKGRKDSYLEGWQEGYGAARDLNEIWWMRAEVEVNSVRENIWREEAQL
jgi:hypothetical protein